MIHKEKIGIYNNRFMYAHFYHQATDTATYCQLNFRYADQLRTPSKYDSLILILSNGQRITLPNQYNNSIEPIESFSNPGPGIKGRRKVLFEIAYSCQLPKTTLLLLQTHMITQIQLLSAPAFQPETWLRKFDITVKRNYEMALIGRHETIIYGNKKISTKQAGECMTFFKQFSLSKDIIR
ncbi:hypothetical protein [Phnomibacter sp. MR]|uniref:hypothetical protein n=1 Tax=Phnomibacter sp. MR TaxID=3042318 RepID=UPI003A7FBB87